jgi:Fe-Mn family superoxide dismutase
MPFTLPDLSYPYEALEPHIDTETMKIHHDKHHAAYVNNLNKALEGSGLDAWSIEDLVTKLDKLPEKIRTAVRNNGGGHLNHSLFWEEIGPGPGKGGLPTGSLGKAIDRDLGGFETFRAEIIKAGLGRFGSGWAWLSLDSGRKLVLGSTANQDNPLTEGLVPLFGIDVWEHAYYLKYQNRRADYLEAFFMVVDWKVILSRFEKAMG